MGHLPQEMNVAAIAGWILGAATNYDNEKGWILFGLGALAAAIKLADMGLTFYKKHIKKK